MSRNAFAAAAALSMMMVGSSAMAAGTSASPTDFLVQIVISEGCTVSNDATPVTFTTRTGVSTKPNAATKQATITCTPGTKYDFHLTSSKGFKLENTSDSTKTIAYEVKATLGAVTSSALGGSQVTTPTLLTGDGTAKTVDFTFDLTGWTSNHGNGTYQDNVTINVDF